MRCRRPRPPDAGRLTQPAGGPGRAADVRRFRVFPRICHRPNGREEKTKGAQTRTAPCSAVRHQSAMANTIHRLGAYPAQQRRRQCPERSSIPSASSSEPPPHAPPSQHPGNLATAKPRAHSSETGDGNAAFTVVEKMIDPHWPADQEPGILGSGMPTARRKRGAIAVCPGCGRRRACWRTWSSSSANGTNQSRSSVRNSDECLLSPDTATSARSRPKVRRNRAGRKT